MNLMTQLLIPALLSLTLAAAPAPRGATKHYVCPPCAAPCDKLVFDKPGVCPQCGMQLVDAETAAAQAAAAPPRKKAAILVFDGVEIIDYTGPWEVLGAAGYEVYTVAASVQPVTTAMGMKVVPSYTFTDAPTPDLLIVPGGGVRHAQNDAATLQWVREVTARDTHTMSVCNGAFILASAGLLDGLTATTTAGNIPRLQATYPKIHVVRDRRFVDNGKIITAGGLSAGIDGALHLLQVMDGEGTAQNVALGLEYDWHPDAPFLRATLADRVIPNIDLHDAVTWHVVRTQGDRDRWDLVVRMTSALSADELMKRISDGFVTQAKWAPAAQHQASAEAGTRGWTFTDTDGSPWTGRLTIEPVAGSGHDYTATLHVSKAG